MNELIIIFLIFILSYILILKDFKFSIYVLMVLSVLLHKELFSFYRWNLMPIRAFMLAVFCGGITKIYFEYVRTKTFKTFLNKLKDPAIFLMYLLLGIRTISLVNSKNMQESILLLAFFATIVALFTYIYLEFKDDPKSVLKYLKFYVFIVFGSSLFGYFQFGLYQSTGKIIGALWNVPTKLPRVGSIFWDVNHYGALLTAALVMLGGFILMAKTWKQRIIYTVMFILMTGSLLLTNSRTSWIFAGIAFLTFFSVLLLRKLGIKAILYVFIAIVLACIPVGIEYSKKDSPFRAKIKEYFHYRLDSFDSHMMLITGSYQVFEEYPILGGGYGSFFEHFSKTDIAPTFFGRDPAALNTRVPAHTIWGELISETGILGLTTFVILAAIMIGVPFYIALNSKDTNDVIFSAISVSTLVGWFMAGIFYSYNSEFYWIVLTFLLAWSMGTLKKTATMKEVTEYFLKSKNTFPIIIGVLAFFMIFAGLGKNHLIPWDEAIYAKIAKNMVTSGDYIVQRWRSATTPWYEKPPLFMWMVAGFMNILGVNSWASRLPSAICGFSTVLLVFFFARKHFNKTVGYLASIMMLTTLHFLYYSRAGMTDVTATFFITASLITYFNAKSRRSLGVGGWLLSGGLIGLAVMTKGVVGFLPWPIIGFYEIYLFATKQQKLTKKLFLAYIANFVMALLVFMPWHIAMYAKFGQLFIDEYIGYHVFQRATVAIEDKGRPFFWYIKVLRVSLRWWFVGFLAALPYIGFKIYKKDNKIVFLMIWTLFIFLFFSSATSKLVWYMMPIYPVMCLMVGVVAEKALDFVMRRYKKINNLYFKAGFLMVFTISSLMYLFSLRQNVYTSDLTGSQARLMQLKDAHFGTDDKVFLDRVELPLALFYTDSQFEIIDFRPDILLRVPVRDYGQVLILLTKKGRYSDQVAGIDYAPKIIKEDGDWVLWYFEPEQEIDLQRLQEVNESLETAYIGSNVYYNLINEKVSLETKLEAHGATF